MGLHSNMRIQMVKCAIGLFTSLPPTFIHSFNLFISTTWALVLLGAGNRDERVNLRKRVRRLFEETKYYGWQRENARCLPDQSAVLLRWTEFLEQTRRCRENCMAQASRADDRRTVAASAEDILAEARGPDTVTCRVARTVSREGTWDSRPLCLDLQGHPR